MGVAGDSVFAVVSDMVATRIGAFTKVILGFACYSLVFVMEICVRFFAWFYAAVILGFACSLLPVKVIYSTLFATCGTLGMEFLGFACFLLTLVMEIRVRSVAWFFAMLLVVNHAFKGYAGAMLLMVWSLLWTSWTSCYSCSGASIAPRVLWTTASCHSMWSAALVSWWGPPTTGTTRIQRRGRPSRPRSATLVLTWAMSSFYRACTPHTSDAAPLSGGWLGPGVSSATLLWQAASGRSIRVCKQCWNTREFSIRW